MVNGKKVVVLPAYNASQTLERTCREIPFDLVDEVVLVDDASPDDTVGEGQRLGIRHIVRHEADPGYGGNQKTCYRKALELGADIVVMLHPDYQYTPKLLPAMVFVIANGVCPVVLGSRILGKGAPEGGHALLQVRGQPGAHPHSECAHRSEAVRVSHGLPRLLTRGA